MGHCLAGRERELPLVRAGEKFNLKYFLRLHEKEFFYYHHRNFRNIVELTGKYLIFQLSFPLHLAQMNNEMN